MTLHDHGDLAAPLMEYLAQVRVVRDPSDDQTADGDLPAVFYEMMDDTDGEAVAVRVSGVEPDPTDSNPVVRVLVTCRSRPWDAAGLHTMAGGVFRALHRPEQRTTLTATRALAHSERALVGPTVPDGNRRWVRTDTFVMRVMVPTARTSP